MCAAAVKVNVFLHSSMNILTANFAHKKLPKRFFSNWPVEFRSICWRCWATGVCCCWGQCASPSPPRTDSHLWPHQCHVSHWITQMNTVHWALNHSRTQMWRFHGDNEANCEGAHSVCGTLSQQGLSPIKLTYKCRWSMNALLSK